MEGVKVCAFEGCGRAVHAHGLCSGHHRQQHDGRALVPLRAYSRIEPGAACSFEGCCRPPKARGLCNAHHLQVSRGKDLAALKGPPVGGCLVSGCTRTHSAKGYCKIHYLRWRKGQSLDGTARGKPSALIHEGEFIRVELRNRHAATCGYAVIDAADAAIVEGRAWSPSGAGYAQGTRMTGDRPVLMHRLILGLTDPKAQADHIDGDRLNNRRSNLRLVTRRENAQNVVHQRDPSMRNIRWNAKRGCWQVSLMRDYKPYHIGTFLDLDEAKSAARDARARHFTHANEDRHR